jgi:hypothetical protein
MEGISLPEIEGQVGVLVLKLDGSVLSASGELAEDSSLPQTFVGLLQDANSLIKTSGKESPFKRLTVAFSNASYVLTVAQNKIYVVKKKEK